MSGIEMCSLSRDAFLSRAPNSLGDILYEHLQILLSSKQPKSNAAAAAAAVSTAEEAKAEVGSIDSTASSSSSFTFLTAPGAHLPPQAPPVTTTAAGPFPGAPSFPGFAPTPPSLSDVGYIPPPSSLYPPQVRERVYLCQQITFFRMSKVPFFTSFQNQTN